MTEWETFCDECYYHMWRVRRKDERHFDEGFHVNNRKEAQALVELLNGLERERDEAREDAQAQARLLGMSGEREAKLLAQLAAERALADRLAGQLDDCLQSQEDIGWVMQALAAWREARAIPAEKKSDFS